MALKYESVTVVIGATDEKDSLIETVDTVLESCDASDIDYFLIVVPKSATSECLGAIDFLKEKYPDKVKKLVQKRPYLGGAMRDSIDFSTSSHIMFLSADIPTGLDCVPVMIKKAKEMPDTIIKTSRWLEKSSFYGYDKTRKFFNFCAQKFLRVLFNFNLTDFTSPVLASPTSIYKKVNFTELNFPCLLESVLIPIRMGCKFYEVPAKCYQRTEGKSKNSVFQTVLYLKTAFSVRFRKKEKLTK